MSESSLSDPKGRIDEDASVNMEDESCSVDLANAALKDYSPTISNSILKRAREQVINEFFDACDDDEEKVALVLELAKRVSGTRDSLFRKKNSVQESNSRKKIDDNGGSNDSSKSAGAGSMSEIVSSPYEIGANAEVSQREFEEFKVIMRPEETPGSSGRRSSGRHIRPSGKAVSMLGMELAEAMVIASHQIFLSGMVYSPGWIDGIVRDINCGNIPKPMLLLCLQEQRFARAEVNVLNNLVAQLGLANVIHEALDDWCIEEKYPNLTICKTSPLPYQRGHKAESQKCELFVARAYVCMNALKRQSIDGTMATKVLACLSIMENTLQIELDPDSARGRISDLPKHIEIPKHPTAGHLDEDNYSLSSQKKNHQRSQAIEKLDVETGRVLTLYSSIPEATNSYGIGKGRSIYHALAGKTKSAYGFFWRRAGTNDLPKPITKEAEEVKDGDDNTSNADAGDDNGHSASFYDPVVATKVEKISPRSGRVVAEYDSIRAAIRAEKAGSTIPEAGTTNNNLGDKNSRKRTRADSSNESQKKSKVMIEKVCPRTGQVLIEFPTAKACAESLGIKNPKGIRNTLTGERETYKEFIWRFQEDTSLNTSMDLSTRTRWVEKISLNTGKVMGIFGSCKEAQIALQCDEGTGVREVCSGLRKSYRNNFWRWAGTDMLSPNVPMTTEAERAPTRNSDKKPKSVQKCSPWSKVSPLEPFDGLPYSTEFPFESDESLFDDLEILLKLSGGKSRQVVPSPEAKIAFGDLASVLVLTYHHARRSSVAFGSDWNEGIVHDKKCGVLPDSLLLLCLQTSRFERAKGVILASIVNDLDIHNVVREAIDIWGLKDLYPHVVQKITGGVSCQLRKQVYECYIFVARVYLSLKVLNRKSVPLGLMAKVRSCLDVLDDSPVKRLRTKARNNEAEKILTKLGEPPPPENSQSPRNASSEKAKESSVSAADDARIQPEVSHNTGQIHSKEGNVLVTVNEIDNSQPEEEVQANVPSTSQSMERTNPVQIAPNSMKTKTISEMRTIGDSAYEENSSAEVGEEMFDGFKNLLVPKAGKERRQIEASEDAVQAFGASLATSMVRANAGIAVSGMLYSPDWRDGRIRGIQVGFIPKPILLLLLQEQRFSRTEMEGVLVRIINDLGLCGILQEALAEWGFRETYSKLPKLTSPTVFTSRKVQCCKCLIFVARAFRCMKVLKIKRASASILSKVEACLQILESNTERSAHHVQNPSHQLAAYASYPSTFDESSSDEGLSNSGDEAPKQITEKSHVLFQHIKSAKASVEQNPPLESLHRLAMNGKQVPSPPEKQPKHGNMIAPAYSVQPFTQVPPDARRNTSAVAKAPETTMGSAWFPHDPEEVILNQAETETAWLTEESIYCLRNREIQWNFVWKYASPTLKVELRKISDDACNPMEQLVRLYDGLVSRRVAVVRREIRRKLHRGFLRSRMRNVIPKLRLASRPTMGNPVSGGAPSTNAAPAPPTSRT